MKKKRTLNKFGIRAEVKRKAQGYSSKKENDDNNNNNDDDRLESHCLLHVILLF